MANATLETIKDIFILGVTPIVLGLIALKQFQIAIKQKVIHGQIDGMKSELVEAVAGRNRAEGKLSGIAQAGKDQEAQPVKIVEQTKTIDVTIKKKDK